MDNLLNTSDGLIEREELWKSEDILAECVMAKSGDDYRNLRPLFKTIACLPVQTQSLNVRVVEARNRRLDNGDRDVDVKGMGIGESMDKKEEKGIGKIVDKRGGEDLSFDNTDALVTFEENLPIGIVTADCVPVLVYAPDIKAVGAIHAGWKGTIGGIVDNVLDILMEKGADLSRLMVFFGPSISQESYEVDEALGERFRNAGYSKYVAMNPITGKPHLDLQGINMERCLRRGVIESNISLHQGCSLKSVNADGSFRYQSHRRSKGKAGRMLSYIMLR